MKNSTLGLVSTKAYFTLPFSSPQTLKNESQDLWVATCLARNSNIAHIYFHHCHLYLLFIPTEMNWLYSVVKRSKCLNLPIPYYTNMFSKAQLYHCFLMKWLKLYKWGALQMPQFTAAAASSECQLPVTEANWYLSAAVASARQETKTIYILN